MAGHPIRVDDAGANEDDLRAVADIFREKGVENLIVTLGGNGSVAVNKDGVARVQSVKMPVVADTTAGRAAFSLRRSPRSGVRGFRRGSAGVCEPRRGHHRFASRRDPEPPDARGGNGAAARARL